MITSKTEKVGPACDARPSLPLPRDAFRHVANYLALSTLIGAVDVPTFDQGINGLILTAGDELQAELAQLKLTIKRSLADAG